MDSHERSTVPIPGIKTTTPTTTKTACKHPRSRKKRAAELQLDSGLK